MTTRKLICFQSILSRTKFTSFFIEAYIHNIYDLMIKLPSLTIYSINIGFFISSYIKTLFNSMIIINQMSAHRIIGSRQNYQLSIDVTTSTVEQHNSFDFQNITNQFSSVVHSHHIFSLSHKYVYVFRNQKTFQVHFEEKESLKVQPYPKEFDLLTVFEIRYIDRNIILRFYEIEDLQSQGKYSEYNEKTICNKYLHQIYFIVRSMKNQQNESVGYQLKQGSLLRIGQKEYFVSSVCATKKADTQIKEKLMLVDSVLNFQKKIDIPAGSQAGECKYCMQEQGQEEGEFLCSPCKCSGSCALVHFNCLQRWNQSKVKKNQVKGLTYYNFQKFCCEVCKEQYPKLIEKEGKVHELMPIQFPQGQHIILEELDIKCFSLLCIQNIPEEGIRMGRGNQCEIRVDSPSISRNHARIIKQGVNYFVFDNKSKFGTTVRDNKIYLELDLTKKGLQIDRTVLMIQLRRKKILQ